MPLPEQNHLRQFLLFVFVLLIPCFAVWTVFSGPLVTPVIGLIHLTLTHWFPDMVNVVYQEGANIVMMTRFDNINGQLVPIQGDEVGLGFRMNTRILSYSIPFYAALHFATEKKDQLSNFIWGVLLLYPFIILGLLCLCLKELMVNLGTTFMNQVGVFVPPADLIAMGYQLNILIIPTLIPALVWVWQSRHTPLLNSLIPSHPDSGKKPQH